MPDIPPTTSEAMLDDEKLYRQQYGDDADDVELCGAKLTQGGRCERPAGECPYHDD